MDVFPLYPDAEIVRVVATQLRRRLDRYYNAFPSEAVVISVPKVEIGHSYRIAYAYHRSLQALDHYNRGKYLRDKGDPKWFQDAANEFTTAIERDPSYAPARVALAEVCFLRVLMSLFPETGVSAPEFPIDPEDLLINEARRQAEAALALDPDSSRAHLILGTVYACHFQWNEAARSFEIAKRIDSEYVGTHPFFAAYLMAIGRKIEAIEIVTKRAANNRYDPNSSAVLDIFNYAARIYDRTAPILGMTDPRSLDSENLLSRVHRCLADIQIQQVGRQQRYYAFTLQQMFSLELDKKYFHLHGIPYLGLARLKSPQAFFETQVLQNADLLHYPKPFFHWEFNDPHPLANALQYFKDLIEWKHWNPSPIEMALAWMALAEIKIHGGIPHLWYEVEDIAVPHNDFPSSDLKIPVAEGRKFGGDPLDAFDVNAFLDLAISALGYACEAHEPLMVWLHLMPIFDPIRNKPAFRELINRMNLPKPSAPVALAEDSI